MIKISVVFPSVNQQVEAVATAMSIRGTAGEEVEIVAVDDCSAATLIFPPHLNVKVHRNLYRIGSGASRHIGAQIATGDYMVMCDSHCRFTHGWLEHVMAGIEKFPDSLLCGVCKGFAPTIKPFGNPSGVYYGADLQFIGKDPNHNRMQVLEAVWAKEQDDGVELSSPMGACYVSPRERFPVIVGMNHLKTWGVEEQLMALKFYLTGSDVRLIKNFVVWHRFRDGEKLPFHNGLQTLLYNKLFLINTIFPEDMQTRMIAAMPRCSEMNLAQEDIRKDWRLVESEKLKNKGMFTRDVAWLQQKFNIPMQ